MTQTNIPAEAHAGIAPPEHAPMDPSQPVTADFEQMARQRARTNERELAPLTYQTGPVPTDPSGVTAATHEVKPAHEVQAAPGYAQPPAGRYVDAVIKSDSPAASNSESPSRGMPGTAPIPAARTTQPMSIVGGFGEAQGEYYPLDGSELREVLRKMLHEIEDTLDDDLRFTQAITYPRLSARIEVIIEGEADDQIQKIVRVMPPHEKTAVDLAREYCDSVTFIVRSMRREKNEQDEDERPADSLRAELGLRMPGKRIIRQGDGFTAVDW